MNLILKKNLVCDINLKIHVSYISTLSTQKSLVKKKNYIFIYKTKAFLTKVKIKNKNLP